jgi:multidrug efflux system outer membrane protein
VEDPDAIAVSGRRQTEYNTLPPAPAIEPGLPSALLERRPDIAQAEREMASRNALIGSAKAAFFPAVKLTATGGLQSGELEDLFKWDSRTWGLSPSVSIPIFQGGRLRAELERSRAAYDEAVAHYRAQVLQAFREVDDSLAAVHFLKDHYVARQQAVEAARNSAVIAFRRFNAGTINFLEVVDAESARLLNELARIRVGTEQLNATVRLIKAMGGGWRDEAPPASIPQP